MRFKFLIRRFIGWIYKKKRFNLSCSIPVKINLGSGRVVAPGWINVDNGFSFLIANFPKWLSKILFRFCSRDIREWIKLVSKLKCEKTYFVYYDLNYGLPFTDKFADFIYSSHLLEHFTLERGIRFLKECNRVLKPGGVIRICVPDLEKYVQFYLSGKRIKFLSAFFSELRGVDEDYGRHRFMYDYNLLRDVMEKSGFKEIQQCEYRKGKTPDLNILDSQPDTTLYVEAKKRNFNIP